MNTILAKYNKATRELFQTEELLLEDPKNVDLKEEHKARLQVWSDCYDALRNDIVRNREPVTNN